MTSIYKRENKKITEFKYKSKLELKQKIKSNLEKRGAKLTEITNTLISQIIPNTKLFYSHNLLISSVNNVILAKVDEWKGVNVDAMHKLPNTFNEYHKRADNWWNRYKAEWIGDYLFYPFFKTELIKYLSNITNNHIIMELIYFMIFKQVINAEIYYHRTKGQPLLLDQSFLKSKHLKQLFDNIGHRNQKQWSIPINTNINGRYRITVRNYVKTWVSAILEEKQMIFNVYLNTFNNQNQLQTNSINNNYNQIQSNNRNINNQNQYISNNYVKKMPMDMDNINNNNNNRDMLISDTTIYPILGAYYPSSNNIYCNIKQETFEQKSMCTSSEDTSSIVIEGYDCDYTPIKVNANELQIGYNWSNNYNVINNTLNENENLNDDNNNSECVDVMMQLTYLQSKINEIYGLKEELTQLLGLKGNENIIIQNSVNLLLNVALPESIIEATVKTKKSPIKYLPTFENIIKKYKYDNKKMLMILTYDFESSLPKIY
eukprot:421142_1